MKHTYALLLILFTPFLSSAQKNFYKLSIGAGAGITKSYGDLSTSHAKKLFIGNADYYLTPFLHGGIELQSGNISGVDNANNRYFNNNFKAGMVTAKVHLGQFMKAYDSYGNRHALINKSLMGFFASASAGLIKSNQTEI